MNPTSQQTPDDFIPSPLVTSGTPPTVDQGKQQDIPPSEEATIKLWRKRIKDAKVHFEPDFKRMRENMEFAANIQWAGQESVDDASDRYIANFITNHINSKVASLYAKDPKCQAKVRDRLNFALWDGSVEQMQGATMALAQAQMTGMVTPQAMQAQGILQDIQQGKQWEAMCKKVGKTLEILYGYQCDTQAPSFKYQMKQLVRRVVTTGVGYVRLNFVRNADHVLSSSLTDDSLAYRVKRAKAILSGIKDDKIQENDPRVEQLRLLFESVTSSIQQGDMTNVEERLEFDFPSSTSIIVDPRCKSLKGFIGAEWIAQQFIMSLDAANSYFGLTGENMVTTGGEFVQYADDAIELPRPSQDGKPEDVNKTPMGCFWEVFDLTTKTHFFICDGWRWYVQAPKPVDPSINRFWPIFSLSFNDIECEPGQKVHVYPPSDVQLLKPMQKERNRSRQELREHRVGNRPFHWTMKGWMSEKDRESLSNHETHQLIEMEGQPVNGDMGNSIGHWNGTPIDQALYSTAPLDDDSRMAVGSNQVQQQMPIRHVAATPAVIQEQARISGVSSNVDDLDDLLSEIAQAAGEMMLREFSPQTVQRIVGKGAAWPDQQREDFLNELFLDIVAASSGRPNKAVDVQNAMQLGPLMLQAGANPIAMIEYYAKVLDSNIRPADFFPAVPPTPMQPGGAPAQGAGNPPPHQPGSSGQPPRPQPGHPHPGNVGMQQGGQQMPPGVQPGGQH